VFLECKEVIKIYTDASNKVRTPALRGIDLNVKEGSLLTIIGSSGSGKSTFINLIGGHDRPSSGEIFFQGDLINKYTEKQISAYRRNNIGFLYQMPERNLLWSLNVQQNVLLPMKLSDKYGFREQKKRTRELLDRVGLSHRKDHRPDQLSGGEARRVGLAVALANDPEILLADEPTGELDSETTLHIIEYIKELNRDLGKTIIVVTHDPKFASMSDKTLKIQDGKFAGLYDNGTQIEHSESREFTYVDKYGTLTIPEKFRKIARIDEYIQFRIENGKLVLDPVNSDQES